MQNLVSMTLGWEWPKVWMNIILFWFFVDKSRCSMQHVLSAKKCGDSLKFLVDADWGRKGYYNQSEVAIKVWIKHLVFHFYIYFDVKVTH